METIKLDYFRVLCKYQNYTKASSELHITQPALSMAIKKLEDESGGELIDRKSKSFTLTEKGKALYKWSIIIHNNFQSMMEEIQATPNNTREIIRFGMPLPLCPEILTDAFPAFAHRHPDSSLNIVQAGHKTIVSDIMDNHLDLGIICKDFVTDAVEYIPYKTIEYCVCFADDHPFAKERFVTPDMLSRETLLVSSFQNTITEKIKEYFSAAGLPINYKLVNTFPDSLEKMVSEQPCVVLVPKHIAGINSRPVIPPINNEIGIIRQKGKQLSSLQRSLIDAITGGDSLFS